MSKTTGAIDHDEEDRDSSEYEEILEEEEEVEEGVEEDQECQPSTSGGAPLDLQHEEMGFEEEVYQEEEAASSSQIGQGAKVYYENEMQDLVIHEIFGNNEHQKVIPRQVENVIVENPCCIVCNRTASEKTRLFRWPKSPDLQEQWAHFFRLPLSTITMNPNLTICSFHFSADSFAVINDRIFWKPVPVPKYRMRRPCVTDPFPWEAVAQKQMDELRAERRAQNMVEYKIRYRLPYNKHKSRSSHLVAVLSPINQPHLFYEFHFNRNGLNGNKFYACLNCRKAKAESGIRDVIRTVHLDGNKLISQEDPFVGHHFACRPHNVYDYRSSWRPVGHDDVNPFTEDIVYVDERGNSIEWDNCTRPSAEERDAEKMQIYEEIVDLDEPYLIEEEGGILADQPGEQQQPGLQINEAVRKEDGVKSKMGRVRKAHLTRSKKLRSKPLNCHLCLKRAFTSTANLIAHLQEKHIANEKNCRQCGKKISCDDAPILQRRQICNMCWKH